MKRFLTVLLLIAALCMTGCVKMAEITDEESEVIAQAAAGLLFKYDKNYTEALSTPTPTPTPIAVPTATATPTPTAIPETSQGGSQSGTGEATAPVANTSFEELVGTENFSLQYLGYEFTDEIQESLVNIKPVTENGQLFIINLAIANVSDAGETLDLMEAMFDYRLVIDETTVLAPLKTVKLNDLNFVNLTLGAGEVYEAVLIFDVEAGTLTEPVGTIDLYISKEEKTVGFQLQ